jgi:lipopolysaccharide transport system ATP-binding protein
MLALSIENVSKVYRLGEIDRKQLFGDVRRWVKSRFNSGYTLGDPELEAEQEPQALDLFHALKNISFEVREGETVGIVGANGAGKSTLLKLISRITLPSSGVIRIKGRLGSLLEVGTGFNGNMTGRENIFMKGAIHGMKRREVRAKFDDIVSFSGVEQFIDTPVKRYSSGMSVRLAFSVAAFLEPEILIVDEVLSVGDQQFKDRCAARIKQLVNEGRTLLFVSHMGDQVRSVCQRSIYLKSGSLIYDGETAAVLDKYEAMQNEATANSPEATTQAGQATSKGNQ